MTVLRHLDLSSVGNSTLPLVCVFVEPEVPCVPGCPGGVSASAPSGSLVCPSGGLEFSSDSLELADFADCGVSDDEPRLDPSLSLVDGTVVDVEQDSVATLELAGTGAGGIPSVCQGVAEDSAFDWT